VLTEMVPLSAPETSDWLLPIDLARSACVRRACSRAAFNVEPIEARAYGMASTLPAGMPAPSRSFKVVGLGKNDVLGFA